MSAAIEVRALTRKYGSLTALDNLDLQVPAGRIVGLIGPNGCGKSTLFKVLAGVLAGWSGHVQIAGQAPGPASKARVSFLPDANFLPNSPRLGALVDWYGDFFTDFDADRALALLDAFDLHPGQRLREMSRGMREKAQIALVMGRRAQVHLLDEPLSGVDPAGRAVVLERIVRGLGQDSTILVATHLVSELEPVLDSVVFMRNGRVVLTGAVDDLRAEHGRSIHQLAQEVPS